MQIGDVPEPLCDPPEYSTDVNNEIDLGNGSDQLMVCHSLLWEWKIHTHIHLVPHCTDEYISVLINPCCIGGGLLQSFGIFFSVHPSVLPSVW